MTIDQKNLLITIVAPPVLLEDAKPYTEIKYTNQGHALDTIDDIFLRSGNSSKAERLLRVGRIGSDDPLVTYRIQLLTQGPMELGVSQDTLSQYIGGDRNPLAIPLINLYGNKLPVAVELTHRTTQEKIMLDSSRIFVDFPDFKSSLKLRLLDSDRLLPGAYDIALKLADGRTLNYPLPFLVKKGRAQTLFYGQLDALAGAPLSIFGVNLFKDDITIKLTNREGETLFLSKLGFDRYGGKLDSPIPADLPPGSYVMQLIQFGQPQEGCTLLNVWKGKVPESRITHIGEPPYDPCSFPKTINMVRNLSMRFYYTVASDLPNQPRLKLVPADGTQAIYYGTITPHVIVNHITFSHSSVTIGKDVPQGQYYATIQYLDNEGRVLYESEPYRSLLEVLY